MEIRLGSEARDKVTGIKGIVTSRTEFLNGCVRYAIQPKPKKDGAIPAEIWVDVDQLEVVGKGIEIKMKKAGGPVSNHPPKGYRR